MARRIPLPSWPAVTALAAGALMPFAFAPWGQWWLAPVMVALLFALWWGVAPRRAAWLGWLFGIGQFGAGVHWVWISMTRFGPVSDLVSTLMTALMVAWLALFPALAGALSAWLFRAGHPARLLLAMPAAWTLMEWVRGWLFTGFPWLHLGYSQTDAPLGGFAPLTGVYGISWLAALAAAALVWLLNGPRRTGAAALLGGLLLIGWGLGLQPWSRPAGEPVTVALLQGNVDQNHKWDPRHQEEIEALYRRLTGEAEGADLIVWPEAAIPRLFPLAEPDYLAPLEARLRAAGSDLLLGILDYDFATGEHYNTIASLGSRRGSYRKRHLVPFGEFIPFESSLRGLLDLMQMPISSFGRGAPRQPPLWVAGQPVAPSICYEIAFGEELITALPEATLLVTVSNNAWFGRSAAAEQMQQMGRMRARETGRWLLAATNDGITAVVDHRGRTVARMPRFREGVLRAEVEPRAGATPYVALGNRPVVTALLLVLGGAAWRRWRRG